MTPARRRYGRAGTPQGAMLAAWRSQFHGTLG